MAMSPPIKPILSLALLIALAVPCLGQATLEQAWQEYEYQNFSAAERLFSQIVRGETPGSDLHVEARIGLAMLAHFRMPGGNPRRAIGMYREIMGSIDSGHTFFPTLLVSLGKAHMAFGNTDTASARVCFETVMRKYPGTVEAHQAAVENALRISWVQNEQQFRRAISFVEGYLSRYPDNLFSGTMLGFCARLNIHMQDYAAARKYLIRLHGGGKIASMYEEPTVVFQIAMISERMLGDVETAKKYYRIFVDKHAFDARLYVCELRLKALEEKSGETR